MIRAARAVPPLHPFHGWMSCLVLAAFAFGFSRAALAENQLDYLVGQLHDSSDFRVRTQAALALGNTNLPGASRPLCGALEDPNDSVRSAAAAALGRLGRSEGLVCLKSHAADRNPAVRSVLARAIESLEHSAASSPSEPGPPGPNDTYYVAIGPTTDRTGRGGTEVADLARAALQQKLLSLGGYAVAPAGEKADAAKRVVKRHHLKGYFLQASIERPQYANGNLTLQVRVTLWTYPGKALQGEFSPRLTMSGTSSGDTDSEDSLIKMALERAIDSFVQVASASN
jgi:hypothetical protein